MFYGGTLLETRVKVDSLSNFAGTAPDDKAEVYVTCRYSNFLFTASEEALAELVTKGTEALKKLRTEDPMSELDEIRKQLDELSDRVTMLESQILSHNLEILTVRTLAKQAERHVSGYRDDVREGFAKVSADLDHITELLTASAEASR